jgi:hypothetical protein
VVDRIVGKKLPDAVYDDLNVYVLDDAIVMEFFATNYRSYRIGVKVVQAEDPVYALKAYEERW